VERPILGRKRTDHRGRFTTQGQKILCTYFPDETEVEREKADWSEWAVSRAGYAKAGRERAPETGKLHFHIYFEFPDGELGKWLLNIWPDVHVDIVRSPQKAVRYVLKGGDEWEIQATGLCTGPLESRGQGDDGAARLKVPGDKWRDILYAIENDNLDEIKERFPHE
jgi:hypothetical protein